MLSWFVHSFPLAEAVQSKVTPGTRVSREMGFHPCEVLILPGAAPAPLQGQEELCWCQELSHAVARDSPVFAMGTCKGNTWGWELMF